ncbi:sensor histidine kinase [Alicyclobacillus fodiniaquatilis]|uniref:histidine kinase n=1 Tax=Alicyclobacillus fodiniaquatilis TaxID=1661150 RepID=A0ABW4JIV2_9BACL
MFRQALKHYVREFGGLACWLLAALLLTGLTVWLGDIAHHQRATSDEFLYALSLGVIVSIFGFAIHFSRRYRFYVFATRQIGNLRQLEDVESLILLAQTPVHRWFAHILRNYAQQAALELQEIERRRAFYETFTTRFAHQMKTPLTVLRLLMQDLKSAQGAHSQTVNLNETLDTMEAEAARMEQALETMLYTARLQSFSFDTHMTSFDVVPLLRELVNEHKAAWIRAKIYPQVEASTERIVVYADDKWLRFICDQIVRNALQYGYRVDAQGQPTGEATTFQIRVSVTPTQTQIAFVDHGIGIRARDVRRVFEPFFTGQNGRLHSRATGMGLYLAAQAAKRIGVDLHVESALHQGTTVSMTIPTPAFITPYLEQ